MSKDYWRDHFELFFVWLVFVVSVLALFWVFDTFIPEANASKDRATYEIQCRKPSGEIGVYLTDNEIPTNRAIFTFYTVENVRVFSSHCHAEITARGGQ